MHTGDRPYPCTVEDCKKAFTQNQLLRAHLKQYHKMQLAPLPRGGARGPQSTSGTKSKQTTDLAKLKPDQTNGGEPVLVNTALGLAEVTQQERNVIFVTNKYIILE